MLTLQNSPAESGGAVPNGDPSDPTLVGGAISGANKTTTPTLQSLGWSSGSAVGIGFNTNQTGSSQGITLNTLVLTIYNASFAPLMQFQLASPIFFNAADLTLQQGNGNAVFNFGLTSQQAAQYNTLAQYGSAAAGFFAGLSASLGCQVPNQPAGCQPSDDGADSFLGLTESSAGVPTLFNTVPDGGSMTMLLGMGLMGLAAVRRKFKK